MIKYLLQEMEKSPTPLFSKRELLSISPAEFEHLVDNGILTYFRPSEKELERVRLPRCQHGCPLTIIERHGSLEAVCLSHPEEDPIPIEQDELCRYAVSLDTLLLEIRRTNRIDGNLHKIEGGYFHLGYKLYDSARVGLVFISHMGEGELVRLAGLKCLCEDDDVLVVLTSDCMVEDVTLRQALQHDKIIHASLAAILNPQTFELPIEKLVSGLLKSEEGRQSSPTELSAQQREDYDRFEYQCFDKVHIPGAIPMKRSNAIVLNGNEVRLADSLFALFTQFVVELKKQEGGWVSIYDLEEEGLISDPGRYQIYSNLRAALQGSLLGKDGKKFIENDGSKNYRVSTHPDFITYDREKLLSHLDPRITELAPRLP